MSASDVCSVDVHLRSRQKSLFCLRSSSYGRTKALVMSALYSGRTRVLLLYEQHILLLRKVDIH